MTKISVLYHKLDTKDDYIRKLKTLQKMSADALLALEDSSTDGKWAKYELYSASFLIYGAIDLSKRVFINQNGVQVHCMTWDELRNEISVSSFDEAIKYLLQNAYLIEGYADIN